MIKLFLLGLMLLSTVILYLLWRHWPRNVCPACLNASIITNADMADCCDYHLREYLESRCIFPPSLKRYRERLRMWS